LWAVAVVVDYVVTWFGFPIPGLGFDRGAEAGWETITHPVDSASSNCYTGPSARMARLGSGISI